MNCVFGLRLKIKFISLFNLFFLLVMGSTVFFGIIHGLTILFQITFTFIYSIFNNNFLILLK